MTDNKTIDYKVVTRTNYLLPSDSKLWDLLAESNRVWNALIDINDKTISEFIEDPDTYTVNQFKEKIISDSNIYFEKTYYGDLTSAALALRVVDLIEASVTASKGDEETRKSSRPYRKNPKSSRSVRLQYGDWQLFPDGTAYVGGVATLKDLFLDFSEEELKIIASMKPIIVITYPKLAQRSGGRCAVTLTAPADEVAKLEKGPRTKVSDLVSFPSNRVVSEDPAEMQLSIKPAVVTPLSVQRTMHPEEKQAEPKSFKNAILGFFNVRFNDGKKTFLQELSTTLFQHEHLLEKELDGASSKETKQAIADILEFAKSRTGLKR